MRLFTRIARVIIFSTLLAITGCSDDESPEETPTKETARTSDTSEITMERHYTIPYKAIGKHETLYEDLVEIKSIDEDLKNIIDYAKEIAKGAGYPLKGDNLNRYLFKKREYSAQIKAYENDKYYLICILPENLPTTSQNLEISISKETREIISIIKGS